MSETFLGSPSNNGNAPEEQVLTSSEGKVTVVADESEVEVDDSFNLSKFQVTHREYFANVNEPAITFSDGKVSVNTACLKKLPKTDYVQILINRETKMLVIRPCRESEIYSLQWCSYRSRDGKRQPRKVTGRLFFLKICDLMGWNVDHRYRILGKLICSNGQYLFVFNLAAKETYTRTRVPKGEKPVTSRTPILPAEWREQFGIPYEEHQKALQISMFDGYAVFGIKEECPEVPLKQENINPPPVTQLSPPDYSRGDL